MKRSAFVCTLFCLSGLTLPCLSQANSNPWNGSWKAVPSSMKFDGPTMTLQTDAEGYTVVRDGKASPKVVCDGKPHDSNGDSVTCNKSGNGYAIEVSSNGKRVEKAVSTVSADGKTMTRRIENFTPGEAASTMTVTLHRVSGGPGAAGEWKQAGFRESQDNGILSIHVNGDTVAFKETDSTKPIDCKLDGTPTDVAIGGSMAAKLDGPHTLKVTYRDKAGTVRRENTFELSSDGRTIHETDVTPAPGASTMSLMFHKM
jgi:uncharacterized Zn-binding protein involved in type VI secretion